MVWPRVSESSPGNAAAVFQSAAQAASIQTQQLPDVAALQLTVANLLSQFGSNGGFLPIGAITFMNAGQSVTYTLGMSGADFVLVNTGTTNAPIRVSGTTDAITLLGLTLNGFGSGTGVVSVGASDSGGTGFRLIRVPN